MKCIKGDDDCKCMIVALLVFSSASYDPLTRMTPRSSTAALRARAASPLQPQQNFRSRKPH
jgi:hypothetical protein